MGLSRRAFLKTAIAAGAVIVARPDFADAYPDFDPEKAYGGSLDVSDYIQKVRTMLANTYNPWIPDPRDPVVIECNRIIDEQIAEKIPPEYRYAVTRWHTWPGNTIDPLMQCTRFHWNYGKYVFTPKPGPQAEFYKS